MLHGLYGFFVETAGLGVSRAVNRCLVSAEDGFGFGNDGPSLSVA